MATPHQAQLAKLRLIAETLVYIFAAECVFGGSGRWLSFGPLSIRILLFALSFTASLPFVLADIRALLRKPFMWLLCLFGLAVMASAAIGLKNGNRPGFIAADITSLLTLALIPGLSVLIDSRKKLLRLLDVVFYASAAVALVTAGLHLALAWMDGSAINSVNTWINDRSLGGLAMLPTGLERVYFRAQIFLQFSILYGVWKFLELRGYRRVLALLAEGAMLFAVIISYTRGFWVGLAASALIIMVLEYPSWKRLLTAAGLSLAAACLIAAVSVLGYGKPYVLLEVVNRFDPSLTVSGQQAASPEPDGPEAPGAPEEDMVAAANEAAVNLRAESLRAHRERIALHPIIGSGLGANLDGLREDGKTEYMYLDMLMKLGIFGFILFLAVYFLPPVWHLIRWIRSRAGRLAWGPEDSLRSYLAAGYLGVALTSSLNPFLTAPMGILMLALVLISCRTGEAGT